VEQVAFKSPRISFERAIPEKFFLLDGQKYNIEIRESRKKFVNGIHFDGNNAGNAGPSMVTTLEAPARRVAICAVALRAVHIKINFNPNRLAWGLTIRGPGSAGRMPA